MQKKATAEAVETIVAIKGFGPDWKCRDYQFAVGQSYKHDGPVEACESGFHAIEGYPLELFRYYAPADSKYAEVRVSGNISRHDEDSKIAGAELSVRVELKIPEVVHRAVDFILARIESSKTETNTGYRSAATNTGDQSAATNTGYQSAATNTGYRSAATNTGDQSAATNTGYRSAATNTGYQSAATNTGYQSAATNTGNWSAATNTGDQSAATNTGNRSAATNTGYQSAATNTGNWSAATNTGNRSAATNTGYQSAATNTGKWSAATNTGDQSAATNTGDWSAATVEGKHSVAASFGIQGKAKASMGSAIVLCYRDETADGDEYGRIVHIKAAIVGQDGIKADVFYTLDADGNFVEAQS